MNEGSLIDGFARRIDYLRLSLTDRCNLRCTYCMPERMEFLPRKDLLSIDELELLATHFVARGIRRIRLTGGEPLVRRGAMDLVERLGALVGSGLDELTLTTNGTMLSEHAGGLAAAGVRRVNVSLDTLDADRFAKLTRGGDLSQVLDGIAAARRAGLSLRINTVALKSGNRHDLPDIVRWAHGQGFDLALIEIMPLGETGEDRFDQYLPLSAVREELDAEFGLSAIGHRTAGPARYMRSAATGGRIGFITPLSENFCGSCNRIRVTATGQLYPCLGDAGRVDLRAALRSEDPARIHAALDTAMRTKPERHDFSITARGQAPAQARTMSVTGG